MVIENSWIVDTFDEEPSITNLGPVSCKRKLKVVASSLPANAIYLYLGREILLNSDSSKFDKVSLWDWVMIGVLYIDAALEKSDRDKYNSLRGLAKGEISGECAIRLVETIRGELLYSDYAQEFLKEIAPKLSVLLEKCND